MTYDRDAEAWNAIAGEVVGLREALHELPLVQRIKATVDWIAFRHLGKVKEVSDYHLVAYNDPLSQRTIIATMFGFRGMLGYNFVTFIVKTAGGGEDLLVGFIYPPNAADMPSELPA